MKIKQSLFASCSFVLFAVVVFTCCTAPAKENKPVIIGYVGGFRGLVNTESLDVSRLSHINYAFVDIKDNRAWLHNEATDTINLRKLSELKLKNPDLKILISIGGWSWSKNFSDATLTDTSRKNFAKSAVDILFKYNLDGIDIDWEYPGMPGDSNTYRPEDKEHYTLLFKELRAGLDSLQKITKQSYLVTTAVGASQDFIEHTEMDKVQAYNDYINLMSYDYRGVSDTISGHHTNLFASQDDADKLSTDKSVKAFLAAGVPANKIVIGIAFYAKGWQMQSADNNGLYRSVDSFIRGAGFTFLKDSLLNKNGYQRYWDSSAKAPYLFNTDNNFFITYDDEESVQLKCRYVQEHKLAGAMFWEYDSDPKEYLLKTIANEFDYGKKE